MFNICRMKAFEKALYDFWITKKNVKFKVISSLGDTVIYDAAYFYRSYNKMPELEKLALTFASGNVLDLGAGVGTHAVVLQEKGLGVEAMELSPVFCDILNKRGIKKVVNQNLFDTKLKNFDTIYALMNGLGMAGKYSNLEKFLSKVYTMLNKGGVFITDSTDISYLFDDENDCNEYALEYGFYGNITYTVKLKNLVDEPFDWLFCGFNHLLPIAQKVGFKIKLLQEGPHNSYLVELKK